MKISKTLLVKAFLIVASVFGVNSVNKTQASTLDGISSNPGLQKLEGVKYAGCIFDNIFGMKDADDQNQGYE